MSLVKHFSYKDIKRATDGFRRILDTSSNGAAYRARFQNGQVAFVKEIKILDDQDEDVFFSEVQFLARLHHRHIVALRGFSRGPKRYHFSSAFNLFSGMKLVFNAVLVYLCSAVNKFSDLEGRSYCHSQINSSKLSYSSVNCI